MWDYHVIRSTSLYVPEFELVRTDDLSSEFI